MSNTFGIRCSNLRKGYSSFTHNFTCARPSVWLREYPYITVDMSAIVLLHDKRLSHMKHLSDQTKMPSWCETITIGRPFNLVQNNDCFPATNNSWLTYFSWQNSTNNIIRNNETTFIKLIQNNVIIGSKAILSKCDYSRWYNQETWSNWRTSIRWTTLLVLWKSLWSSLWWFCSWAIASVS
jgi:hypothetical protein